MAFPIKKEVVIIFNNYSTDGYCRIGDFRLFLENLGAEGSNSDSYVVKQFALADKHSRDNKLDLQEFAAYYNKVTAPTLLQRLQQEDSDHLSRLRATFKTFSTFGTRERDSKSQDMQIGNARFFKLVKDSGLIDKQNLTSTDVDLIFVRSKSKGSNVMNFEQFLSAVSFIAEKKNTSIQGIIKCIVSSSGPSLNKPTTPEFIKFYDDKGQFTGVHKAGGPSVIDISGDQLLMRGNDKLLSHGTFHPRQSKKSSIPAKRLSLSAALDGSANVEDSTLKNLFLAFAAFGGKQSPPKIEMDGTSFMKMMRESGILGGTLTSSGVDLCFTKVTRLKKSRKMTFADFLTVLPLLAHEKGIPVDHVKAILAGCQGPLINSSMAAEYAGIGVLGTASNPHGSSLIIRETRAPPLSRMASTVRPLTERGEFEDYEETVCVCSTEQIRF